MDAPPRDTPAPLPGPAGRAAPLVSRILPATAVDGAGRAAMYRLYAEHYEAAGEPAFMADLAGKTHVLEVRSTDGTLRGFTTMAVSEHRVRGARLRVLFSGDTIMHPAYWGRQDLAFTWIRFAGRLKAEAPGLPLLWFLIVKGHRTYRYLSAFSLRYHPQPGRRTTVEELDVLAHLARERFGQCFDKGAGVIRFPSSRGHLRADLAAVTEAERRRPDVAHFLALNPGYVRGDELACLCELSEANLRPIARRLFREGMAAG